VLLTAPGGALGFGAAPLAGQPAPGPASDALVRGVSAPEARGVMDLPRLQGPVTLDGLSDEDAWEGIEPVPLTMYQPTFRGSSQRRIELLIGYDDEAIYVAARFYHDDPADIRAFSLTRDRYGGDDGFALLLDTFNDKQNAVRFTGLPLGTRIDHSIQNDGRDPGPGNGSWRTFWDLETRITEEGWFGEMRIPFSSLRFETRPDGSVIMGLLGFVYESREDTRWTFPAMPSSSPYGRPSAFQEVRLQGIVPQNPVYVAPYGLSGAARYHELSAEGSDYARMGDRSLEFGADLKFTPTPNLTLDLTLNTDFAAVEADQQQVNLTRFSLFFEEKRPFFQERAGIFAFDTGADRGTLFYSRRIGLADGRPLRILGGGRLVGRVGDWDLGLIQMQTAAHEALDLNSENFGILRLQRRVLNANSFVGAMGTSRVDTEGRYNVTYGVDGSFRVVGDEYLTLKWLQTFQGGGGGDHPVGEGGPNGAGVPGGAPGVDAAPAGLEAGRLVLDWTRRRLSGLAYQAAFTWSGPGYDPGIGFEPRRDFTRGQGDLGYTWFPGEGATFRRIWLGARNSVWVRNPTDEVETVQVEPFLQLETGIGMVLRASSNTRYEDVDRDFSLSESVGVPAGRYWATEGAVEIRAARAWPVRPNVTLTTGEFFDGTRIGLRSDVTWPASRHLEVVGGWEWNRVRFQERNQALDSRLLRLTLRGAVDTRFSIDAFGQYNSLTGQLTGNTRFRYNFREGQDLWLVWNEGLNLDRDPLAVPRLPFADARTLTLKYSHTLIF
jgi:hypothetical protein